ncbi:hypothetical protein M406DRAFT_353709 [Cryphonectria parasitica EP155]|uniref:Uncharacterized protein n=1 Tax=Cryphonectria parasitica (strain ATCC 38755 / EP155) TaxID=660469 RepID=A0A9P5CKL7_CRYP1|nr:uncharacterized protein M406DRAFT_353709 [Cryphonectria parasitica EP155]KAF3761106.1 hypothetical protein M406DRAFT_353709 [Cryphonectria parasitica EP155]
MRFPLLLLLVDGVCAQYARFAMMGDNNPDLDLDPDDSHNLRAPQYYWHPAAVAASPPFFAKRDGDCGTDSHPCSDINSTLCCPDTTYCLVNSTSWQAQCCDLGSTCGEACTPNQYLVNYTSTITRSATTTQSTYAACAPRVCTSTNYLCPSSLGGGCCAYGSDCGVNADGQGVCLGTAGGTTSTASTEAMSTLVTPVASGCTAQGQTYCTAGGGCCDAGYACTLVSSQVMCSAVTATPTSSFTAAAPTGSGITVEHKSSSGDKLSSGAKAGIAVGVVVVAALVIGFLTWFCLRRRRRSGASAPTVSGQEMRSVPPGGGGGEGQGGNEMAHGAAGSGWGGRNLSEADGTSLGYPASTAGTSRAGRVGYQDYFGPENVPTYMEMGAGTLGAGFIAAGDVARAGAPSPPNEHPSPEMYASGVAGGGRDAAGPHQSPVEMAVASKDPSSPRRPMAQAGQHARIPSDRSDGGQSELADTSSGPAAAATARDVGRYPQASSHSIDQVFELMGSPTSPIGPGGGGGEGEVFYDAHEGGGGGGAVGGNRNLPQPFPTPASEMSEFGTPSPMSREE